MFPVTPPNRWPKPNRTISILIIGTISGLLLLAACSRERAAKPSQGGDRSLVLALAVLGENDDGTPKTLPGRLGILTRTNGKWNHRTLEDKDNNVFHKAMAYGSEGLLTSAAPRRP